MRSHTIAFCLLLLAAIITLNCQRPLNYDIPDSLEPGKVKLAGVRASSYGIRPFPQPAVWKTAMDNMVDRFEGSTPCAIWILGVMHDSITCSLQFPGDGKEHDHIVFSDTDRHDAYLTYFDEHNIKVFLQVEPASADVPTVIDLVLNRYKHHPCVIGFGVDVEWHELGEQSGWGIPVTDEQAQLWEETVKSHNPDYQLFLKHWDRNWMPPGYRGEILFINDSQMLKNFKAMVKEFSICWADHFKPNPVGFQIGYLSDERWWGPLENPPKDIGLTLANNVGQTCNIFWVDFTLRDVVLAD